MIRFKTWTARTIGRLSRASGRGGGTTLPGRVLLKLDGDAITKLGQGLTDGTTLISATNGKTTTASMLATILDAEGRHPVHNRAGSNMTWGVATALAEQKGKEGLFEVDEAWLPEVAQRLHPKTILLGNLFRDQLDRYGETEALADAWASMAATLAGQTGFVLNADDPLIADIGKSSGAGTIYFGIDDESQALPELQHAHDAKLCRNCGNELTYERAFVGHLGHYQCEACGMKRPRPDISAGSITLKGMSGLTATVSSSEGSSELELPLPGLYNLYNALGAIATATKLGVPVNKSVAALAGMKAVFGRVERITIGEVDLSILLIKNPAGANEVIRTLALEPAPVDIWIALNDRIADGRDVSWIWDADFEVLAGRVGRITCTGTRASEMALRLKYAGWPAERTAVIDNPEAAFDQAVATADGQLFALPTYTALLDLRNLLAARGNSGRYWAS